MARDMQHFRWAILLRGIAALLFGLFTLINPGIAAVTLVLVFGSYAVVNGLIAIGLALFSKGDPESRLMLGIQGGLHVLLGGLVLAWPGITMLSLLFAIVAFALIGGISEIVAAFRMRSLWLGVSGLISILFGAYAFRFPGDGALTVLLLIGIYSIMLGIMLILGSFQMRRLGNDLRAHMV